MSDDCQHPSCSNGWVPVIEVREHGRVVETRPWTGLDKDLECPDGCAVYEVNAPCPECNAGYKPHEERLQEKRDSARARETVKAADSEPLDDPRRKGHPHAGLPVGDR